MDDKRVETAYREMVSFQSQVKDCKKKLQELMIAKEEAEFNYRKESVNRVLDWIRSEYRKGNVVNIETYLYHCQNKLNGNIDGTELDLKEEE